MSGAAGATKSRRLVAGPFCQLSIANSRTSFSLRTLFACAQCTARRGAHRATESRKRTPRSRRVLLGYLASTMTFSESMKNTPWQVRRMHNIMLPTIMWKWKTSAGSQPHSAPLREGFLEHLTVRVLRYTPRTEIPEKEEVECRKGGELRAAQRPGRMKGGPQAPHPS